MSDKRRDYIETQGRIIVRRNSVGLVFAPARGGVRQGIYDIEEFAEDPGRYYLKWIGEAHLQTVCQRRFEALSVDELFHDRPASVMTTKEMRKWNEEQASE